MPKSLFGRLKRGGPVDSNRQPLLVEDSDEAAFQQKLQLQRGLEPSLLLAEVSLSESLSLASNSLEQNADVHHPERHSNSNNNNPPPACRRSWDYARMRSQETGMMSNDHSNKDEDDMESDLNLTRTTTEELLDLMETRLDGIRRRRRRRHDDQQQHKGNDDDDGDDDDNGSNCSSTYATMDYDRYQQEQQDTQQQRPAPMPEGKRRNHYNHEHHHDSKEPEKEDEEEEVSISVSVKDREYNEIMQQYHHHHYHGSSSSPQYYYNTHHQHQRHQHIHGQEEEKDSRPLPHSNTIMSRDDEDEMSSISYEPRSVYSHQPRHSASDRITVVESAASPRQQPKPKSSSSSSSRRKRSSNRQRSRRRRAPMNEYVFDTNNNLMLLQDVTTESLRAMALSASLASEALGIGHVARLDPDCMQDPKTHCADNTKYMAVNAIQDLSRTTCNGQGTAALAIEDDDDDDDDVIDDNHRKKNKKNKRRFGRFRARANRNNNNNKPVSIPASTIDQHPQQEELMLEQSCQDCTKTSGTKSVRMVLEDLMGVHQAACTNDDEPATTSAIRRSSSSRSMTKQTSTTTADTDEITNTSETASTSITPRRKKENSTRSLFSIMNRTLEKNSKKHGAHKKNGEQSCTSTTIDTATETVASGMAIMFCDYLFAQNGFLLTNDDEDDDEHATSDDAYEDDETYGSRTPSYQSGEDSAAWTTDEEDGDDDAYEDLDPFGVYGTQANNWSESQALPQQGAVSSKNNRTKVRNDNSPKNPAQSDQEPGTKTPESKGRVFGFLRRGGRDSTKESNGNNGGNRLRRLDCISNHQHDPSIAAQLQQEMEGTAYPSSAMRPSAGQAQPTKGILKKNNNNNSSTTGRNRAKRGRLSWSTSAVGGGGGDDKITVTQIKPTYSDPRAIYQSQGEEHRMGEGHSLHTIQLGRVG